MMSTVRGHSFAPTSLLSIPPFPLLPSISPPYAIPQWCQQSSPNISTYLWALHWVPLPFYCFFLCFFLAFLTSLLTDFNGLLWIFYQWPLCLFLSSLMFIFIFIFIFISYVTVSHLYFWGLNFPFTYSHRLPLAGLYPFHLGSPTRCVNYCNYLCQ